MADKSAEKHIPIIALGHLFASGGTTVDGDGVRELYVGSLAHVDEDVFPSTIDYLALGHLHVPQTVGGAEDIRYSGSPIPMGFGEAAQEKSVVVVDFHPQITEDGDDLSADLSAGGGLPDGRRLKKTGIRENLSSDLSADSITLLKVPCFQELVRIVGSLDDIHAKVEELKKKESCAWLEIEYTGNDIIGDLREMLDEALVDTSMEIRRIKNRRVMDRIISTIAKDETLDDLTTSDVFIRCLDAFEVSDEDREELTASYNEIIKDLKEDDLNAE